MNYLSYKRIILLMGLYFMMCPVVWSQETMEIYPNVQSQKKMKLCATFLGYNHKKQDHADLLQTLENVVDKYKVDILNAHGFNSDEWLTYKGYENIRKEPNQDEIRRHREYYQRLKKKGIYLIIGAGEPVAPKDLF